MTNLTLLYTVLALISCICALIALLYTIAFMKSHKKDVEENFFSSLLDYDRFIDDSTILLKTNNYLSSFYLEIPNLNFFDRQELDRRASILEQALLKLDENFCIQLDFIKKKTDSYNPFNHSNNKTLSFYENKRRAIFKSKDFYTHSFYLSISSVSSISSKDTLLSFFTSDKKKVNTLSLKEFKQSINNFVEKINTLYKVTKLSVNSTQDNTNFLSYLSFCIAGKELNFANYNIDDQYLSDILALDNFRHLKTPLIGDKYISVIAIDNLPFETFSNIQQSILSIQSSFRFNIRFVGFDKNKAAFILNKQRKIWSQSKKPLLSQILNNESNDISINAQNKIEDVDKEREKLDDLQNSYGSYTSCIVLMSKNLKELQNDALNIINAFEQIGFNCHIESINSTEAYLGTLPSNFYSNLRSIIVSNKILADLIPLSLDDSDKALSSHKGFGDLASCVLQASTRSNFIYNLNLHIKDLGNSIIIGPPGSGKSVLLAHLILSLARYKDIRMFIFDKGYSLYAVTKALNGVHTILDNNNTRFCPLYNLETQSDLDFAYDFICLLLSLSNIDLSAKDSLLIKETIQLLKTKKKNLRSLSDFIMLINDKRISEGLKNFSLMSDNSSLLDGTDNLSFENSIFCFECQDLMQSNYKLRIATLYFLFRQIERRIDKNPLCIIIDEAWMMLDNKIFSDKILEWIKTLRKHNVFVIMATQSIYDISKLANFSSFLDCIKSKIFLANSESDNKILQESYLSFGLNAHLIKSIATMQSKKEYLLIKENKASIISLVLSDEELLLCSLSTLKDKALVDRLIHKYGSDFYRYLKKANYNLDTYTDSDSTKDFENTNLQKLNTQSPCLSFEHIDTNKDDFTFEDKSLDNFDSTQLQDLNIENESKIKDIKQDDAKSLNTKDKSPSSDIESDDDREIQALNKFKHLQENLISDLDFYSQQKV